MSLVNDFNPEGHIPYLIDQAHRRMQQDLAATVDASAFPDLRGSHFRLLSMIPEAGARPSELAEFAGMTRPALGELVRHLENTGYVTSRPDTSDGRAVIVGRTARGRKAAAAAERAIRNLNRTWAREIGAERLEALLDACAALTIRREP